VAGGGMHGNLSVLGSAGQSQTVQWWPLPHWFGSPVPSSLTGAAS